MEKILFAMIRVCLGPGSQLAYIFVYLFTCTCILRECVYFLYLPVSTLDRVSMLMAEGRSFGHSRQGLNQSALYLGFHLLKAAVLCGALSWLFFLSKPYL
jgi:hypothetical protein